MKKIIAAFLLVVLSTSLLACGVKNDELPEQQSTSADESKFEGTDEEITETETKAQTEPTWERKIDCNGVSHSSNNSEVKYIINQKGELSLHIADWNETHFVTSLSAKDIENLRYSTMSKGSTETAIGINNERAFLLLKRHYEPTNQITVVSFEKGSGAETAVNLAVDDDVHMIYGNFIDENIGYVFAFAGTDPQGDSTLSSLFQTKDGGKTWSPIDV